MDTILSPNLYVPLDNWLAADSSVALPLIALPLGDGHRYITLHASRLDVPRLDAKSIDYFQRYINKLIDNEGILSASQLSFDLLFEYMQPNKTFAHKLIYAHGIFDQYWRNIATIEKISIVLNKLASSRSQWKKYKESIVRAVGDIALSYNLQFYPDVVYFKRIRPYQILIEEYDLLITDDYIIRHLQSHTNDRVAKYLKSNIALCTKPKDFIANVLLSDSSLKQLPTELLNIISDYIR